jgi:ribose transport system permease protein
LRQADRPTDVEADRVSEGNNVGAGGLGVRKARNGSASDVIRRGFRQGTVRYGLVGVWIIMAGFYAIIMPGKFLQTATFQAILGSQSSILFLAFASLATFVVGEFDLSFAGVLGLTATIVPVMTTLHHTNVWVSCLIALAASLGAGLLNSVFIILLRVPSLVVTLGTASLFLGIAELISSSNTVAISDPSFSNIALYQLGGLPLSFYYGVILAIGFAYVMYWTPLGRNIAFVGSNRDVARLAGINVNRIRMVSYIVDSLIAGIAGILLVASVGGFDSTASSTFLLPALAAVFLGTAMVMPGQFNPIGTFLGIYFLETGVLGLQLLGYSGWVQDAFYGGGLVIAVTLATVAREHVKRA